MVMMNQSASVVAFFEAVALKVRAAGVFGEVAVLRDVTAAHAMVRCDALASGDPAFYSLSVEDGKVWVNLKTAARYLSQSIEQDLVHTGDKIPDLLHEELVELGYDGPALTFEHFRDEAKLYTFRSVTPIDVREMGEGKMGKAVELGVKMLLGYEATFRPLGDMEAGEEE
jgi:hypothetical protein